MKNEAQKQRQESRDFSVVQCGRAKTQRVDLGLHLLSIAAKPGATFSLQEIALWCGCTRDAIMIIEKKALKKLHNSLRFGRASQIYREVA